MRPYEEALALIRQHVQPLSVTNVTLAKCASHVLAQSIKARMNMPRFTNSAMDGVAVRHADLARASKKSPVTLPVVAESRAGKPIGKTIGRGQAVRIFTGAEIPKGADVVIPQEDCTIGSGEVTVSMHPEPGAHIRYKGEGIHKGAELLAKGTVLEAAQVALLASQGLTSVPVHRKPSVAIVTSGDELVRPGNELERGEIYDSVAPGLEAACARLGLKSSMAHVGDQLGLIRRKLARLLESNDVVIIAGGVSVGDYDFVKLALAHLGVRQVYWQLAVRPGKPNYFGVYRRQPSAIGKIETVRLSNVGKTFVFGLPGNPVSALVSYLKLVKPALALLMGAEPTSRGLAAKLATGITKQPGRLEWVRARIEWSKDGPRALPVAAQGSHMLGGLAAADCLIDFPQNASKLARGSQVAVEMIDWGL